VAFDPTAALIPHRALETSRDEVDRILASWWARNLLSLMHRATGCKQRFLFFGGVQNVCTECANIRARRSQRGNSSQWFFPKRFFQSKKKLKG